jgi:phenylalanine-4-hydroxylase
MTYDDLNASELILDPKHPGINDAHYIARRKYFFDLGREFRLQEKGIPIVQYEPEENAVWSFIYQELETLHQNKACELYLVGKEKLALDGKAMPKLHLLNARLKQEHNIGIAIAEGLLHTRSFFYYLSQRLMPCTQFIRHHSNPEYTPEPDAVHDVLGHVPALMNEEFNDIIELIGKGVTKASDEELPAWERIYWFSIEFGLIQQGANLKVFGAGILSSFGEMTYCFSEHVTRKPFLIEEVIRTPYDPTLMQTTLFIISSLSDLKKQILAIM